jgi:hypothetical protein
MQLNIRKQAKQTAVKSGLGSVVQHVLSSDILVCLDSC